MIDHPASGTGRHNMFARTSQLGLLVFTMWATALVTMDGATTRDEPGEMATLLPENSNDSQTTIEIRAHFKSREFAEVAHLSNALIQSHPRSWEGYFWKGAAAIQQREFYSAVRNLRAAEKLEPPHNSVAKNLAIAYYLLDQQQLFEIKMKEAIDAGEVGRTLLARTWTRELLIGRKTIEKLRVANILDGAHRVKVSRAEVRQIVTRSLLWYPWPRTWRTRCRGPAGLPAA